MHRRRDIMRHATPMTEDEPMKIYSDNDSIIVPVNYAFFNTSMHSYFNLKTLLCYFWLLLRNRHKYSKVQQYHQRSRSTSWVIQPGMLFTNEHNVQQYHQRWRSTSWVIQPGMLFTNEHNVQQYHQRWRSTTWVIQPGMLFTNEHSYIALEVPT